MSETTARLDLPLLAAGQAQKELFHNEALALLDVAVQASVVAVGVATPPAAPVPGQCWVVGSGAQGAWAGQDGAIAAATDGGWRFVAAFEGMAVWDRASGSVARHVGGQWTVGRLSGSAVVVGGDQVVGARRPAIADPAGGATVDAEARAGVAAILAALRGHGLIAS